MGPTACPGGDAEAAGVDMMWQSMGILCFSTACLVVTSQAERLSLKMQMSHLHIVRRERIHVCQTQKTQNRDHENLQLLLLLLVGCHDRDFMFSVFDIHVYAHVSPYADVSSASLGLSALLVDRHQASS